MSLHLSVCVGVGAGVGVGAWGGNYKNPSLSGSLYILLTRFCYYSPKERGHIAFGADTISIGHPIQWKQHLK